MTEEAIDALVGELWAAAYTLGMRNAQAGPSAAEVERGSAAYTAVLEALGGSPEGGHTA